MILQNQEEELAQCNNFTPSTTKSYKLASPNYQPPHKRTPSRDADEFDRLVAAQRESPSCVKHREHREIRDAEEFSFRPVLNQRSVRIGKSHSVEDLMEWRDGVWRRQAARSVEEFTQECTFVPKVTYKKSRERQGSVGKRLYQEAKERERSKSRAREEAEKGMFKPHINPRSKELYTKSKGGMSKVKLIETIESTERIDYVHICYGEEESITKKQYKQALEKAKLRGSNAKERSKERAEKAKQEIHERPPFIVNDVVIGGRSEKEPSQKYTSEESELVNPAVSKVSRPSKVYAKFIDPADSLYDNPTPSKPTARKITPKPQPADHNLAETPTRPHQLKTPDRNPLVLSEILQEQSRQPPNPKPLGRPPPRLQTSEPVWPESPSREEVQHRQRFQKMRDECQTNVEQARAKRFDELRTQHKQQKQPTSSVAHHRQPVVSSSWEPEGLDAFSQRDSLENFELVKPAENARASRHTGLVEAINLQPHSAEDEDSSDQSRPKLLIPLLPEQSGHGHEWERESDQAQTPAWISSARSSERIPPKMTESKYKRDSAIRSIFEELFESSQRDTRR